MSPPASNHPRPTAVSIGLGAFGLKSFAYDVLLLLFGPALLLIFRSLPFANDGDCDPWYVYGLYFNLPEQVRWAPAARQVGRLTGVLPGYLLTHVLPAVASDYAIFLLFFSLAVFFLYKTAALLFSRPRAALIAIFFATSPIVVGNYAVTFSGPIITYEVLALYCVARAIRSSGPRQLFGWMFLSGIAWGAGLHAHLAVLAFSDFIYVFFALCVLFQADQSIRCRIGRIAAGAAATLFGVAVITAAMIIFAALVWGPKYWSIILNQLLQIPDTLANNAAEFWQPDWYYNSPKIGMFLLGLGAAAIGIVTHGRDTTARNAAKPERVRLAIAISFALTMGLLIVNDSLHGIFLQYDYYYVLLWPFLALTILAVIPDSDFTAKDILSFCFAIACLLGIAIKQYDIPHWAADYQVAESIAFAILAVVLILALQRNVPVWIFAGYLLVLATSTLFVRPHDMGGLLWEEPNDNLLRPSYARLNSGLRFLAQTFSDLKLNESPQFWADEENVSDALSYPRSYLWCGFHRFPEIDPVRWQTRYGKFHAGDILVIVARPPNLFNRARTVLNDRNLEPTELASKTMADEEGPYEILVVRLSGMGAQ